MLKRNLATPKPTMNMTNDDPQFTFGDYTSEQNSQVRTETVMSAKSSMKNTTFSRMANVNPR